MKYEFNERAKIPLVLSLFKTLIVFQFPSVGYVHHGEAVPVQYEVHQKPSHPAVAINEGVDRLEADVEVGGEDKRVYRSFVSRIP